MKMKIIENKTKKKHIIIHQAKEERDPNTRSLQEEINLKMEKMKRK